MQHRGSHLTPSKKAKRSGRIALAFAATVSILASGLGVPVAVAAPLSDEGDAIGITKSVMGTEEGSVPVYKPGETFDYKLTMECSSLNQGICIGAEVTDPIPAPLQLISAEIPTGGAKNVSDIAANKVGFRFTQTNTEGVVGMKPGTADVIVTVKVPADITWEQAQTLGSVNNTATFKSGSLVVEDSAAVSVVVEQSLKAKAIKSADDNMGASGLPIPAVPGKPVDYVVGGGNESNRPVDTLALVEPAQGSSNLEYLNYQSVGPIKAPAGADRVSVSYLTEDGSFDLGTYPTPVAALDLSSVSDLGAITGFVYVFSSSSGAQLPPAQSEGDYATVGLGMLTNALVNSIEEGGERVVHNVVSATVTVGEEQASDTAAQDVKVKNSPPGVEVTKSYDRNLLIPGDKTFANLRAVNGDKDVVSMTVADPGTTSEGVAQPNLHEQGLTFAGFEDGANAKIEWPASATKATITYTYEDGTTEVRSTEDEHTIPAATRNLEDVVGFSITYTGDIKVGSYASIPFQVEAAALAAEQEEPVTTTNHVDATVVDADGKTVVDRTSADITRKPVRVYTQVEKNIVRDEIYDVAGSSTYVTLPAKVLETSTVGSEYLIVQDPADTSKTSDFWNVFDASLIGPTAVDNSVQMVVEYWDGSKWIVFSDFLSGSEIEPIAGPTNWQYVPTEGEKAAIQGIRYTFTPVEEGTLLEPGFNVLPYFKAELRGVGRDGKAVTAGAEARDVVNDVKSTVENDRTGQGPVSDTAVDAIKVTPWPANGGPGVGGANLIEKTWTPEGVVALTEALTTVTLKWGTGGLPLDSMLITDHNPVAPLKDSPFDAFNLVEIPAITPQMDPGIWGDRVSAERFSVKENGWVPVGKAGVGKFDKVTLTKKEQEDTIGVRFKFEPIKEGDHVTSTTNTTPPRDIVGLERQITLKLQLRDYLRSAPTIPALGTEYGPTYNTGKKGFVNNTALVQGVVGEKVFTDSDSDTITITDEPQNVTLTKNFLDGSARVSSVGVPQAGTPGTDYPIVLARLVAKNTSATRVGSMTVVDPDPSVGASDVPEQISTVYDHFNVYRIVNVPTPSGAESQLTRVRLTPAVEGKPEFTVAEAKNLTPQQLENVISVEVFYTGAKDTNGAYTSMIKSGASATIDIEYQLRQTVRGTEKLVDPDKGATLTNHAKVTQTRPGVTNVDATANAQLKLADASYGVKTNKSITPKTRTEEDARTGYTVSVDGQPTGTVRTKELSLTDATPTFWNAFEFAGFNDIGLPTPVNALKLGVLTGVEYEVDASDATAGPILKQVCKAGSDEETSDLSACWKETDWLKPMSNSKQITAKQLTEALVTGLGFTAKDVQGLRFTYASLDGKDVTVNWERPSTPKVNATYKATRRENLAVDADGKVGTPVPSTRPDLVAAPGEKEPGLFTNTVEAFAQGSWKHGESQENLWTASAASTTDTKLTHLTNAIYVDKVNAREHSTQNEDTFSPGAHIPFTMTVQNRGQWNITGLKLEDQVATDTEGSLLVEPTAEYSGAEQPEVFAATYRGKTLEGFIGKLDEKTGKIVFTLPDGFVLETGQTLTITADLKFRQTGTPAPAGQFVSNTISATSDRMFDTCDYREYGVDKARVTDTDTCASITQVKPLAVAPMSTYKSVKGVGAGVLDGKEGDVNYNDLGVIGRNIAGREGELCSAPNANLVTVADGFYITPCVPVTRPGGTEEWRVQIVNEGNIPVDTVATIDVLPALGDRGVIIDAARASLWAPTFTGSLSAIELAGGTLSTYYSTVVPSPKCTKEELEATVGGPAMSPGCATERAEMWQGYSESLSADVKAQIRALKFVVTFSEGSLLQPNQHVGMSFQTQTPWYSEGAKSKDGEAPIAWNSLASASSGVLTAENGQPQRYPSSAIEPRKVGVAMAQGALELQKKQVLGIGQFPGIRFPENYNFGLKCVSGGQEVPLVDGNGTPLTQFVVSSKGELQGINAGGGKYSQVNIPLYADCTVVELDAQGAQVTFEPTGAKVTAQQVEIPANLVNAPATATLESVRVSATNEYLPGGFEVSKTVDYSGAIQHDRDATFGFTASCMFLNQEVLSEKNRAFTLKDGQSKAFENLPAGSVCRVEETDRGMAASASVTVTPKEGATVEGSAATFTIAPYGKSNVKTDVSYENVFTVGAVEVTKKTDGLGAEIYGAANFTFNMACVLEGAKSNPVFQGTHTMKAGQTWRVDSLPTGAACTVAETVLGGATATAITPATVTVGNGEVAQVTATNTFDVGNLAITKVVDGDGAEEYGAGPFTFQTQCAYQKDGETTPISLPDGGVAQLPAEGDNPWTILYEDLLVGATCSVVEVDAAGATSTVMTPTSGEVQIPAAVDGVPQVARVSVVNTFDVGAFAVQKSVEGPFALDSEELQDATFTVAWSADNGESGTLELSNEGDWKALSKQLPVGTTVTLTEVAVGSEDLAPHVKWDGYTWLSGDGYTVSPDGLTATLIVDNDAGASLGLENRFEELFGSFAVQKVASGDFELNDPQLSDLVFNVDYVSSTGETGTLELSAQNGWTLGPDAELRVGSTVTLTEDTPTGMHPSVNWNGYTWVAAEGQVVSEDGRSATITIGSEVPVRLQVSNDFTEERASFSVEKLVEGDFDLTDPELSERTFTVPYQATHPVTGVVSAGELELNATGNWVAQPVEDFALGTVVTLTETAVEDLPEYVSWGGYRWMEAEGVSIDGPSASLTVGSGEPVGLQVVNEFNLLTGGFSLNKAISGVEASVFPEDTVFEVRASWILGGEEYQATYFLPLDGTVVDGGMKLPVGTEVTLEEVAAPEVEGYTWEDVTFSSVSVEGEDGQGVVIIGEGENTLVTATNHYGEVAPPGPIDPVDPVDPNKPNPGDNPGDDPDLEAAPSGKLPVTGAAGVGILAVLAVGLMALGIVVSRRDRKVARHRR